MHDLFALLFDFFGKIIATCKIL